MFYTYIHATPEGEVFYVGKGKGRRVYSMKDRSWEWHEEMQRHDGILMKIVSRFATEVEAFEHEKQLIADYKKQGANLVNKSDGGLGPNGYVFTERRKSHLSELMSGFKHKTVVCPHCETSGGETSMKRWHFENCTGVHPQYKIRATIFGKRVHLGKAETAEKAQALADEFKEFALEFSEA